MLRVDRLRAIGYVRVSTQEQVAEGASLDAQRRRIEAWAEATDADLWDVIEDAGVSGSRPLSMREGGRRIESLLDARNPEADAVVITRLDRLGRDAAENLACL